MFPLNWLDNFLKKEAAEESQLSQQHAEINIFDSKAEGDKVRSAALDLYGTEKGALVELTWFPSSYKMFSKEYTSLQDAQAMFNEVKAKMLDINKMILEGQMEAAEEFSRALLTSLASMSSEPLQQTTNQPVTTTQADLLQVSILLPAISKEAKATVQNIFFSSVQELMEWQEAQKAAQPQALPGALPGATPDLPPLANPEAKGPLMDTPAKPSALEQMVDEKVTEKVESSLDAKARAIFDDVHAETVKVLRQIGRSWEEIKDFFNRYLKYDWDDIDVYLDQFIKAEQGTMDPGTEKVKDEMAEEGGENAPPEMGEALPEPEVLPVASKKPAVEKTAEKLTKLWVVNEPTPDSHIEDILWEIDDWQDLQNICVGSPSMAASKEKWTLYSDQLSAQKDAYERLGRTRHMKPEVPAESAQASSVDKKAELVRYPDSLKQGDKVTLVRSIMTKENLILQPTVEGRILHTNEYSIVIESSEGRFTISKHDCNKLDKTAALTTSAKVHMECLECEKKFSSSNTVDPKCPKCGSHDLDVTGSFKELCDACGTSGHSPEKDWEKCKWGSCECPCQTEHKATTASGYQASAYSKECDDGKCTECREGNCVCECHHEASLDTKAEKPLECMQCGEMWEAQEPACPNCGAEGMDVSGSVELTAEKYYLDPEAEYDWEADLIDEINGKLGKHKKEWDFASGDKWEVEYEGDMPYVNIKLLGPTKKSAQEPTRSWTEQAPAAQHIKKEDPRTFLWQKEKPKTAEVSIPEAVYECAKCGGTFAKPTEILYSEYPGAPKTSVDFASPCCHAAYSEVGDDGSPLEASMNKAIEKMAKGERPKIRELKDQLAKATKPAEIKSLCDAIDALEGRMDKEKERKDLRKEEKAKKAESAPKTEEPAATVTASSEENKKEAATPTLIRTLMHAKHKDYFYTVAEYNLATGRWKQEEIKSDDTKMRMEQEGQQYEIHGANGWQLVPRNIFMEYFKIFNDIRQKNNYGGDFPQPPAAAAVPEEAKASLVVAEELKKK